MKPKLFDTISPKVAWFPIGFISSYLFTALVFCIVTNPFETYLVPFYCSALIISLLIFITAKKLRKIDFDGQKFHLRDTRNQETSIDALLFKEVTSIFLVYILYTIH